MQGNSFQEAVQRVSSSMRKIGPKTVPTDVLHFVLVWERGDGTLRVFSAEHFVQEDKIREATTDFHSRFLKGGEVGLEGAY